MITRQHRFDAALGIHRMVGTRSREHIGRYDANFVNASSVNQIRVTNKTSHIVSYTEVLLLGVALAPSHWFQCWG
jgi:hypothetical protein